MAAAPLRSASCTLAVQYFCVTHSTTCAGKHQREKAREWRWGWSEEERERDRVIKKKNCTWPGQAWTQSRRWASGYDSRPARQILRIDEIIVFSSCSSHFSTWPRASTVEMT